VVYCIIFWNQPEEGFESLFTRRGFFVVSTRRGFCKMKGTWQWFCNRIIEEEEDQKRRKGVDIREKKKQERKDARKEENNSIRRLKIWGAVQFKKHYEYYRRSGPTRLKQRKHWPKTSSTRWSTALQEGRKRSRRRTQRGGVVKSRSIGLYVESWFGQTAALRTTYSPISGSRRHHESITRDVLSVPGAYIAWQLRSWAVTIPWGRLQNTATSKDTTSILHEYEGSSKGVRK